jgi:hypothetical protein
MGQYGAACFNTMDSDSRELSKYEWDKERFGQLCMTAETFADWKGVIEKLCSQSDRCRQEEEAAIEDFFSKVEEFNGKLSN